MLAASGKAGLAIVVGQDSPEKLRVHAADLGPDVYLDESGEVFSRMGGGSVPQWFTLSSSYRVLEQEAGTITVAHLQLERMKVD